MLVRLAPMAGVVLFLGIGFGWRAWLQRRKFGSNGLVLFNSDRWSRNLADAAFCVLLIVLLAQAAVWAVRPSWLARLTSLPLPETGLWWTSGVILLVGGIVLMVIAQWQLGASWRVGIDEQASPGLITDGLYRVCRNPIFLAMFTFLAGYTLVLPTWLSLLLFAGTVIGIRRQVVEEEAYLSATYGRQFQDYAARVGRFLPGVGRL